MKQTVYCDCFYCEYYEEGICVCEVLHLKGSSACREFEHSEEKLEAKLATARVHSTRYDGKPRTSRVFRLRKR